MVLNEGGFNPRKGGKWISVQFVIDQNEVDYTLKVMRKMIEEIPPEESVAFYNICNIINRIHGAYLKDRWIDTDEV